jgi:hypothetical protein
MCRNVCLLLCAILCLAACQQTTSTQQITSSTQHNPPPTSDSNIRTAQIAQQILEGTYQPKMDEQTSAVLDSVLSESPQQRQYYFTVYRKMISMGESEADDILGSFTKALLLEQPAEVLQHIQTFSPAEQKNFIGYLAYEFLNSGDEYLTDINTYFADLAKDCPVCNTNALATLKKQLIEEVKTNQ